MQITVPFCFLPNSRTQVFDMDTCKRSLFQVNTLSEISKREDFAYFVTMLDAGTDWLMHPDYKGPCTVTWYSKEGIAHSISLGVKRNLNYIVGSVAHMVPLDHVVYTSRC